jgi:hypothetical protein
VYRSIIVLYRSQHANRLLARNSWNLLEHDTLDLELVENFHRDLVGLATLVLLRIEVQILIEERPLAAHLATSTGLDVVGLATSTASDSAICAAFTMISE